MANAITDLCTLTSLDDSDLLVVLQHDKYLCNKYNTCSMSSITMFDMLMEKVLDLEKLQDTAHMPSSSFSPLEHSHDNLYNKLDFEFQYGSQHTCSMLSSRFNFKNVIEDAQALSIGNMFIDGTLVPVEIPSRLVTSIQTIRFTAAEPTIGSLKFVALSDIKSNSSIQYKSADFDGWLYPDGSSFFLSDFALSNELKTLYGSSSSNQFTLPNLRNFVKLNGKSGTLESAAGKNVLKKHSHAVDVKCATQMFFKLRMPGNTAEGNGGTLHNGDGKVKLGSISSKEKWISYQGQNYSLKKIINLVTGETATSSESNTTAGTTYHTHAKLYFDQVEKVLSAIDDGNGTSLCKKFREINTLKLNPIDEIQLTTTINIDNDIGIQDMSIGIETYPSHVILPVMIYVGQRKRTLI